MYVLVGALLSILQTFLAFALFAPRVPEVYGATVMARGITARLSMDLFFCGLVMVFSVLIRKPILSFAASFCVVALFFSNRAVILLPISGLYEKALDCIATGEGFGTSYLPLAVWTIVVFVIAGTVSVLYMNRAELK